LDELGERLLVRLGGLLGAVVGQRTYLAVLRSLTGWWRYQPSANPPTSASSTAPAASARHRHGDFGASWARCACRRR